MQMGSEEDPGVSGVPSHPQRRAHPRGNCCLRQSISSYPDKTQIRSFSPFQTRWAAPPPCPLECEASVASGPSRIPALGAPGCSSPSSVCSSITLLTTRAHAHMLTHMCSHGSHAHTQNTLADTHPCVDTPVHPDTHAHKMRMRLLPFCLLSASFLGVFSVVLPAQHPVSSPWDPQPRCGRKY